jgi:hypothetical protein
MYYVPVTLVTLKYAEGRRASTCHDAGTKGFLERHPETSIADAGDAVVLIADMTGILPVGPVDNVPCATTAERNCCTAR